jgi:uracil-DNA glycosylase
MNTLKIEPSWHKVLCTEFEKDYFLTLSQKVKIAYQTQTCYPKGADIFRAFELCPFDKTQVVIVGQDPYHQAGQANGLCFSVQKGVAIPPSLQNIYKEISSDLNLKMPKHGDLTPWASQGILLLNAVLTVQDSMAGAHQNWGWERFTDGVIDSLSREKTGLVFMLWGNYAQQKGKNIDQTKHKVLKAVHPSPLAANRGGWFGNKHFSQTQAYLAEQGKKIDFSIGE